MPRRVLLRTGKTTSCANVISNVLPIRYATAKRFPVSRDEIRKNGYNLNIPRYVDSSDPVEKFDIYATIFGGIPNSEIDELQKYWNTFPSLREELFVADADKPYSQLKTEDTQSVIEQNTDVKAFQKRFTQAFEGFGQIVFIIG